MKKILLIMLIISSLFTYAADPPPGPGGNPTINGVPIGSGGTETIIGTLIIFVLGFWYFAWKYRK